MVERVALSARLSRYLSTDLGIVGIKGGRKQEMKKGSEAWPASSDRGQREVTHFFTETSGQHTHKLRTTQGDQCTAQYGAN